MKTNENLRRRTRQFAIRVINLAGALPKTIPGKTIAGQIVRSGTSVGANYAESCRPKSPADFINKIGTVMQELEETRFWLELLPDAKLCSATRLVPLNDEVDQLMAIFSTMIEKTKRRNPQPNNR